MKTRFENGFTEGLSFTWTGSHFGENSIVFRQRLYFPILPAQWCYAAQESRMFSMRELELVLYQHEGDDAEAYLRYGEAANRQMMCDDEIDST